jgi:hypothetical protein
VVQMPDMLKFLTKPSDVFFQQIFFSFAVCPEVHFRLSGVGFFPDFNYLEIFK